MALNARIELNSPSAKSWPSRDSGRASNQDAARQSASFSHNVETAPYYAQDRPMVMFISPEWLDISKPRKKIASAKVTDEREVSGLTLADEGPFLHRRSSPMV